MAYIDFTGFSAALAAPQTAALPINGAASLPGAVERLTPLEWSVVAIARGDRLSSLRRPGWVTNTLRALFNRPNPRLADPRLEALRRMAVLTWRDGYAVAPQEVRAFVAAGFTPGQYETMVDSISIVRARPRPGPDVDQARQVATALFPALDLRSRDAFA